MGFRKSVRSFSFCLWLHHVHLVQLSTRRGDLLDAELAELSLELAEGLGQILAVLRPQLAGLDLSGRLRHCQRSKTFLAGLLVRAVRTVDGHFVLGSSFVWDGAAPGRFACQAI